MNEFCRKKLFFIVKTKNESNFITFTNLLCHWNEDEINLKLWISAMKHMKSQQKIDALAAKTKANNNSCVKFSRIYSHILYAEVANKKYIMTKPNAQKNILLLWIMRPIKNDIINVSSPHFYVYAHFINVIN